MGILNWRNSNADGSKWRKARKQKELVNPELEREKEWNLNREGFRGAPRAYMEMMGHCGKIDDRI